MFRAGLVLLMLPGCFTAGNGTMTVVPTCGEEGTCEGAEDCYSVCFCETADASACEAECGDRGDRVQDLDEAPWGTSWEAIEAEVVSLTNQVRAEGACCGGEGCFSPVPPLTVEPLLRRSSRAHARDMGQRDYFSHDSQDGRTAFDRIRETGFRGCAMGENIAAGQVTPQEAVESWLDSPEHCVNLMSEDFDVLGVGYYFDPDHIEMHLWVQNFGG